MPDCCGGAVDGRDRELARGVGGSGDDGEALEEIAWVGDVGEVATVGDGDGAVHGERVGGDVPGARATYFDWHGGIGVGVDQETYVCGRESS